MPPQSLILDSVAVEVVAEQTVENMVADTDPAEAVGTDLDMAVDTDLAEAVDTDPAEAVGTDLDMAVDTDLAEAVGKPLDFHNTDRIAFRPQLLNYN